MLSWHSRVVIANLKNSACYHGISGIIFIAYLKKGSSIKLVFEGILGKMEWSRL